MEITLYKKSKLGKTVQLTIERQGPKYRTITGQVGGKMVTSEWTTATPKNVGKSNELDASQQAAAEVMAKVEKKKKEGYTEDPNAVDEAAPDIKPMLAKPWADYEAKTQYPVFDQPKLDGIRMVHDMRGPWSRKNNPFFTVPHITVEAKKLLSLLPPGTKLDGELYNHSLRNNFNRITELVKIQKPTQQDLIDSAQVIEYHIYDIDLPGEIFAERTAVLLNAMERLQSEHLVFVDTTIIDDKDSLDLMLAKHLEDGYEGQMARAYDGMYENSRSKFLLKRKEFMDEEFDLMEVLEGEGNRSGMAGSIKYFLNNNPTKTFQSGIRGGEDFYRRLWKDRYELVGARGTVRFQNYTPDGVPRFPVTIAIRDYE